MPNFCELGPLAGDVHDNGNDEESDECPKDCAVAFCGDGFLKFDEDCDDGNFSDNDGCEKDCRPTVRFIFVTSKLFTGAMGGLSGADKACNDLAEGMLPGTYKAWLSINMDYPAQRMTHSLHPYVRSDGAMIAKNWEGLVSGALLGPIDYTEKKVKSNAAPNLACPMPMVHTNTNASGMPYSEGTDCAGWMSKIGVSKAGSLGQIDEDWTESCYGDTCKLDAPIYCVQQ